ncbi:hypothetical protein DFR33_101238 [Bradymonas sediminis]|uniref:Uncharacterized protein n=2 Tax=Bradymonas sediminis TaxID=1548548 RepID=A0A2Z4FHR7_9DELT|nr:hypothetical protein DN745_02220 [Bradymonas sediminis]TDP77338.1 hypothetical protein DFR33_101238 [Bradymonas sediminis]
MSLEQAVEAIEALIDEGELEEASAKVEAGIAQFGEKAALLVLKADLALDSEDYEACIEVADAAIAKLEAGGDEPDAEQLAHALACKGYALFYSDQIHEARQTFNASVAADGGSWTAILGRASVHDYLNYITAAMTDLERAIEMDDEDGQPYAIRGMIHLRFGRLEDAEKDLRVALDADADDEESRLNLARIQALKDDSAGARETLEHLINEGEDAEYVAPGALLRSQLALGLGSAEAAAQDAQRAIDLYPELPWGYLALAAARITGGQAGDAISTLKEVEDLVGNPLDFPDIFALRAAAYDQLGKEDKAKEEQDKAEGAARLPEFVYGPNLNPSQNVPLNPNKPIDIRGIMRQIFGDPDSAPAGYEDAIRKVIAQIPQYIEQHQNVGRIEVELPPIPGREKGPGNLVIQLNRNQQPAN